MGLSDLINPVSWLSGISKAFGVDKIVGGWQERKTIKATAEAEVEKINAQASQVRAQAMLESARTGNAIQVMDKKAEGDWDMLIAGQMEHTWKDEAGFIVFMVILLLHFVPGAAEYMLQGWEALQAAPWWFYVSFMGIIAATYGLRWWFNRTKLHQSLPGVKGDE